jgi:aminopeptidase YwaD
MSKTSRSLMDVLSLPALLAATLLVPSTARAQAQVNYLGNAGCPLNSILPRTSPTIEHVRYLSADALEGRSVGSHGEECARLYLALNFGEMGLRGLNGGGVQGYLQPFPVRVGSEQVGPGALEISGRAEESGKAWTPFGFSGKGDVRGPLVYVGPGVGMPGLPEDAYAHLDIKGRVAVVEAAWAGVAGMRADVHLKGTVLQGRGASGVIILLPPGATLPNMAEENRPALGVPVVALAADAAERMRQASKAGSQGRLATDVRPRMVQGHNVLAMIPGTDPVLKNEYVVIGAHYDHLGHGGEGSLAPDSRAIHNGADDNASGTAALIAIAKQLEKAGPKRSIVFMAYSGEERGLLGSTYYVEHPLVPLAKTVAMLNLDMVGRLGDKPLTIFGMATAKEWEPLVKGAAAELPGRAMQLTLLPDGFGPSDHSSFYGKGIPVLHFFSGTHAEYHRPEDDVRLIDAAGLDRIATLTAKIALRLAGSPTLRAAALTPVVGAGAPHSTMPPDPNAPATTTTTTGYGPYFGSIPDMTPQTFGVRITGVRDGSPAALAGLKEGDVLVSFGGKPTADLYAFTYALQEHKVGDKVEVEVIRNGQRIKATTTLTERP